MTMSAKDPSVGAGKRADELGETSKSATLPPFYIQVDRDIAGQVKPEFNTEKFVKGTTERLQQISALVKVANKWLSEELNAMEQPPSSCSLEFGIDVGGEVGIPFITKGTIEANFKVTIGWGEKK
jgi:hypothetical protein